MTGGQPRSPRPPTPGQPAAGAHVEGAHVEGADAARGSAGAWYAALIGAVLLVAVGVYTVYLYQQVKELRGAAGQLMTGQEMLRADRDEILQKARDREVALSTLEAAREQDRLRLEGLEKQRVRLQSDVLRLTQSLAESEQQVNGAARDVDRDRLDRDLARARADVSRLETALDQKARALEGETATLRERQARIDALRAEKTDLEAARTALEEEGERLERQLAEARQNQRLRQIIRGHRASLGEVRPYIAEVGPEDWSVIESWLARQLRRPMSVPDLSAHGWSYEGARLLGTDDGPPMAMLLYADSDDRPVSVTIARHREGERPLEIGRRGGLNVLGWQEEHHAFVLAGEAGDDVLEAAAADLQSQPSGLDEDAPVAVSRYIRPSFRPAALP